MKFVDSILSKFKKVDESDRERLKTVREHMPIHDLEDEIEQVHLSENTSLGSIKSRSGPSKSMTRLRAFVKHKTIEELQMEDADRQKQREDFTNTALNDIGHL